MDIWERLYNEAAKLYQPQDISPFVYAHHVVCALETASGQIFSGFCIESASGVLNLCAERVAAVNMLVNSNETVVKRIIAFRDKAPDGNNDSMPCGACREFFMQLNKENENMEIMMDFTSRKTIKLKDIYPIFWGEERYQK